jgi:hypothetical protein
MRLLRTLSLGAATLAVATLAFAGTALAGGWAEVSMSDATTPPVAGETQEIRFVLMQHGVTPVAFGQASVTAVLPGTDETVTVPAQALGDGEWSATITFPRAGAWELTVSHSELATTDVLGLSVAAGSSAGAAAAATGSGAGSQIPAFLAVAGIALITILALAITRGRRPATPPARAG